MIRFDLQLFGTALKDGSLPDFVYRLPDLANNAMDARQLAPAALAAARGMHTLANGGSGAGEVLRNVLAAGGAATWTGAAKEAAKQGAQELFEWASHNLLAKPAGRSSVEEADKSIPTIPKRVFSHLADAEATKRTRMEQGMD